MAKNPVVLIVLDGWGYREEKENNAIAEADTSNFDKLWNENSHALLGASGEAVGLPQGQMGNSEVGHITIGAGAIQDTDLIRVSEEIRTGQLAENPVISELSSHVKKYDSTLHLVGLIGPGGVHAHEEHLVGILKAAKANGVEKIAIHAFTDGRDTPPQSSAGFLKTLEGELEAIGAGSIATASGRFYAMDRDKNWERIAKAQDAIFSGKGSVHKDKKPSDVLRELYKKGITDEHVLPLVFLNKDGNASTIGKNDGVLFFNFRADRARQISRKIEERIDDLNLYFATLTQYDPSIRSRVAFPPTVIETTLAKELSLAGIAQVHIAETEKFAHATYYLNGGVEKPYNKERHVLIDSRKDIDTHDKAPDMRAKEIADEVINYANAKTPFIFVNFANPDMVGHTGSRQALLKAIETVDVELGRVIEVIQKRDGIAFITADHGNAELNIDENGYPHTAHTTNDVPAILVGSDFRIKNGTLSGIAPTILELLGVKKPAAMTGTSLLEKK